MKNLKILKIEIRKNSGRISPQSNHTEKKS